MKSDSSCSRRKVLGALAGASLAAALPEGAAASARSSDMVYRTFGRTGVKVSAIGLGGSHVGSPPTRTTVSASCERPSTAESPLWITAGTTTAGRAKW